MESSSLKRFAPIALAVGLLGLIVAVGVWLIQKQFNTYVQASVAVGLLGLAVAMLLNPSAIQVWLRGRQARYGGNVAIMVVALLGILVLVNYLVVKNPKRWDLTENKINTLAPESIDALKQLQQPVKAIGFFTARFASGQQDSAKNLLEQYRIAADGKFSYEFHDPDVEPALARENNITQDATLVLVMGTEKEELTAATEDQITGAVVRLAHPGKRGVYFVTGHGEPAFDGTDQASLSTVAGLLTKQNYELKGLDLTVTTTVPSDARLVVVAGPAAPLSQDEVDRIKAYLDQGGSLLVMLDPLVQFQGPISATEPLVDYLTAGWGLQIDNDIVVDLYNSVSGQPLLPTTIDGYGSSPITSQLKGTRTVYPLARSMAAISGGTGLPGINYTSLITLDPNAWGETNLDSLSATTGPTQDDTDKAPPLTIGMSVENNTTKGRVVVFGDSDFATNNVTSQVLANGTLFVNAVNWATVDESLINLTPKTPTQRTFNLTNAMTVNLIAALTIIVMPLLVLIFGGVVWFQRRRHA